MKKLTLSIFAFFIVYIAAAYSQAVVHPTQPEVGITCITVQAIFTGKETPAGCYTGNIQDQSNKLDIKATQKYQPDF